MFESLGRIKGRAIGLFILLAVLAGNARPAAAAAGEAPGPAAPAAPAAPAKTFPYPITTVKLDNGLILLVVPLDSPGVASFYTLVRTGSRNEVEPGKTGFAHFFEHMMFRGTKTWPAARRSELIAATGSDDNGWTTTDYTC